MPRDVELCLSRPWPSLLARLETKPARINPALVRALATKRACPCNKCCQAFNKTRTGTGYVPAVRVAVCPRGPLNVSVLILHSIMGVRRLYCRWPIRYIKSQNATKRSTTCVTKTQSLKYSAIQLPPRLLYTLSMHYFWPLSWRSSYLTPGRTERISNRRLLAIIAVVLDGSKSGE